MSWHERGHRPRRITTVAFRDLARKAAKVTPESFSFNCLYRLLARSSALAVRKIFSGAEETQLCPYLARGNQSRRTHRRLLPVQQGSAHRGPDRHARGSGAGSLLP